MPTLVVRSREGVTATVELTDRPLTIGRGVHCDIVLRNDGGVSREHARVTLDEHGRVVVADLGSKNGTRIDGGEIFRNGTRTASQSIRIGEFELEIVGTTTSVPTDDTSVLFTAEQPTPGPNTHFFPSSKRLDLNHQRLGLLMSLTERIGGTFERKQLLEQAIDACCDALGFERGLIALKTPRGEPELPVTRNVQRDETGAIKISRTLINKALIDGERAVVNDPATDLVDNLSESLVRFPIRSALCVPILHRDETLGVIYGDRITQASTYSPEDVDFLAAIAQQVGVGLANLRLFQEHLRAQKFLLELEQARAIQRRLLPARVLCLHDVTIEGYNQPSSAVGGDYYDCFDLGDNRIGITIADVTGHGLPASLMMANLQAAVRVTLTSDAPLPDVAARLNALTCQNTDADVFVTAIIGRVDATAGRVEFISAGHHGPILLHPGRAVGFEPNTSLPLGVEPHETYHVHTLTLGEQDLRAVLFYTDGLIEAENADGAMLDLPPLLDVLATIPDHTADAVIARTLDATRQHLGTLKPTDDLTLMALAHRAAR